MGFFLFLTYINGQRDALTALNLNFSLNPQDTLAPRDLAQDPNTLAYPRSAALGATLGQLSVSEDLTALRLQVSQSLDLERAWRAVSETARDLTVLREPDSVLQAIVERSRVLLGSHLGWISGHLVDSMDELVVLAINGVTTESTQLMRVTQDRGVAGFVRRTRAPLATSDYFSEKRVIHDEQVDAMLRAEGVQSMLAVPMLSGADFIGVLVLADRVARRYTPPDIATLGMLAAHAVVAIRNAQAYAQTRQALAQAEHSNVLLQQHTKALELAAEAHERLTTLVAQGGSQVDVCRTVASLLGAEVIVVDGADTVLCSAGPDGLSVTGAGSALHPWLAGLHVHAALDDSRLRGRSVPIRAPLGRHARLAAIVGGTRLLGGLLVLDAAPLSDVALRTLERSAMVMALMLLAPPRTLEAQAADAAQLLADLLHPLRVGSAQLARMAAMRGLSSHSVTVLALIEVAVEGSIADATSKALQRRLQASLDSRALLCELDGRLVVLCPDLEPAALRLALQKALGEKPQHKVLGLISARCQSLAQLPSQFAKLFKCLGMVRQLDPEPTSTKGAIHLVDEFAPFVASFGAAQPDGSPAAQAFIDATIGQLLAHDQTRGTQLAASLLMYLDLSCNAKQAASRLEIHVNTLNNRLATASALLGSLDRPGRRLSLHLALQLEKLRSNR